MSLLDLLRKIDKSRGDPRSLQIEALRELVEAQGKLIENQDKVIEIQDQLLAKLGLAPVDRGNV